MTPLIRYGFGMNRDNAGIAHPLHAQLVPILRPGRNRIRTNHDVESAVFEVEASLSDANMGFDSHNHNLSASRKFDLVNKISLLKARKLHLSMRFTHEREQTFDRSSHPFRILLRRENWHSKKSRHFAQKFDPRLHPFGFKNWGEEPSLNVNDQQKAMIWSKFY